MKHCCDSYNQTTWRHVRDRNIKQSQHARQFILNSHYTLHASLDLGPETVNMKRSRDKVPLKVPLKMLQLLGAKSALICSRALISWQCWSDLLIPLHRSGQIKMIKGSSINTTKAEMQRLLPCSVSRAGLVCWARFQSTGLPLQVGCPEMNESCQVQDGRSGVWKHLELVKRNQENMLREHCIVRFEFR